MTSSQKKKNRKKERQVSRAEKIQRYRFSLREINRLTDLMHLLNGEGVRMRIVLDCNLRRLSLVPYDSAPSSHDCWTLVHSRQPVTVDAVIGILEMWANLLVSRSRKNER